MSNDSKTTKATSTNTTTTPVATDRKPRGNNKNQLFLFDRDAVGEAQLHKELGWAVLYSLQGVKDPASRTRKLFRILALLGDERAISRVIDMHIHLEIRAGHSELEVLKDVADSLTDAKRHRYVRPIEFFEGKLEDKKAAAKRLIRTAVLHHNKVTAANWREVREAIVKAKIISADEAKKAGDDAKKERDALRKAEADKKSEGEKPTDTNKKK